MNAPQVIDREGFARALCVLLARQGVTVLPVHIPVFTTALHAAWDTLANDPRVTLSGERPRDWYDFANDAADAAAWRDNDAYRTLHTTLSPDEAATIPLPGGDTVWEAVQGAWDAAWREGLHSTG